MDLEIPEKAAVMTLPDCNFFPHTLLPLRIFEEGYRAMLTDALHGERMFCIGTRARPERTKHPIDASSGIYMHGTIGLIRASLSNEDGTSDLVLQGIARVLFVGWMQTEPYRVAVLHPLGTVVDSPEKVGEAAGRLAGISRELIERSEGVAPELVTALTSTEDPVRLADMAAYHLLQDVHGRHGLLGMESLLERLEFITDRLESMLVRLRES